VADGKLAKAAVIIVWPRSLLGEGPFRQFGNSIAPLSSATDSDGVRGHEAETREFQQVLARDRQKLSCGCRVNEILFPGRLGICVCAGIRQRIVMQADTPRPPQWVPLRPRGSWRNHFFGGFDWTHTAHDESYPDIRSCFRIFCTCHASLDQTNVFAES
jgi:hypothetical protein